MKKIGTLLFFVLLLQNAFAQTSREWYDKGRTAFDKKEFDEAINCFDKAIEKGYTPLSWAYCYRGLLKKNLGKNQEAIADYDKAIELDPKYAIAYSNRALSKQSLGENQEAIADYDKAIELAPKIPITYYNRGILRQSLGGNQEAIADYDKVIELDPKYTMAYNSRGYFYFQLKNYPKAIDDWEMMQKVATSDFKPIWNYIDEAKQKSNISQNQGQGNELDLDYMQAIVARGANNHAEAEAKFTTVIEKRNSRQGDAYHLRGISRIELKKFEGAVSDFNNAIKNNFSNAYLYDARGFANYNLGNYQSAVNDWDKMNSINQLQKEKYNSSFFYILGAKQKLAEVQKSPQKTTVPTIYAFIVGVENYRSAFAALDYATDDAYYLQHFLTSVDGAGLSEKNIKLITDAKATKENILVELQKHSSLATENDLFLFYFSGHGVPGYFVPFANDGMNESSFVSHREINNILKRAKSKNKLIIADACFSGESSKAAPSLIQAQYYKDFMESKGSMSMLSSSRNNEMSLEADGHQHGHFTYHLVEGLRGKADDDKNSIITLGELYDYLSFEVRKGTNYKQNPTVSEGYDVKMPLVMRKN